MDLSPVCHAAIAVIFQLVTGLYIGDFSVGGVVGCVWFIAREHTQAEYRWIASLGGGKRANMPWWGGVDWRAWNISSLLDWVAPVVACTGVYLVVN